MQQTPIRACCFYRPRLIRLIPVEPPASASVIKVTAGGSAVHETLFPGQPHEMMSVYTADGPDLIMTHYSMLGNQPRMKADPSSVTDKQIRFQFAGGGNFDPQKDKHMHAATLTIVDADHIEIEGAAWENGAPAKNFADKCNSCARSSRSEAVRSLRGCRRGALARDVVRCHQPSGLPKLRRMLSKFEVPETSFFSSMR